MTPRPQEGGRRVHAEYSQSSKSQYVTWRNTACLHRGWLRGACSGLCLTKSAAIRHHPTTGAAPLRAWKTASSRASREELIRHALGTIQLTGLLEVVSNELLRSSEMLLRAMRMLKPTLWLPDTRRLLEDASRTLEAATSLLESITLRNRESANWMQSTLMHGEPSRKRTVLTGISTCRRNTNGTPAGGRLSLPWCARLVKATGHHTHHSGHRGSTRLAVGTLLCKIVRRRSR
mmetsp:Transcript_56608/g.150989  ORF Transcript_56608/g.150989 Transcript_56608/m.150989 type:complete len:233 (+) Transcript_56608:71-769(+)